MSKYMKPKLPPTVQAAVTQPSPVVTPVGAVPIEEDEEEIIKKKRRKKAVEQEPIMTEAPPEGAATGQLLN